MEKADWMLFLDTQSFVDSGQPSDRFLRTGSSLFHSIALKRHSPIGPGRRILLHLSSNIKHPTAVVPRVAPHCSTVFEMAYINPTQHTD